MQSYRIEVFTDENNYTSGTRYCVNDEDAIKQGMEEAKEDPFCTKLVVLKYTEKGLVPIYRKKMKPQFKMYDWDDPKFVAWHNKVYDDYIKQKEYYGRG